MQLLQSGFTDYYSVHEKLDFQIYRENKTKRDFHIITQDGDHNPRLLHKYIQHSVDADKQKFLLHKEVIIPA